MSSKQAATWTSSSSSSTSTPPKISPEIPPVSAFTPSPCSKQMVGCYDPFVKEQTFYSQIEKDKCLDFFSENFDVMHALYLEETTQMKVITPIKMNPLANLAAYESMREGKKKTATSRKVKKPKEEDDDDGTKVDETAHPSYHPSELNLATVAMKKKRRKNVLERMECLGKGPIAMLHNSLNKQVRVELRGKRKMEGVCKGILSLYDKHFNIVLKNAVHVRKELVAIQRGEHRPDMPRQTRTQRRKAKQMIFVEKEVEIYRSTLMIRGDVVATISCV
eukprot:m.10539 g.10539  ORF g.10539 m.10539 type:complete len:277 (+) comp3685_c0_seq1:130-960(+)